MLRDIPYASLYSLYAVFPNTLDTRAAYISRVFSELQFAMRHIQQSHRDVLLEDQ